MSNMDTPAGRIALHIAAFNRAFEHHYERNEYKPRLPNAEDYRREIELYVQRELLSARILQETKKPPEDYTLRDLRAELENVEKLIAANPL